MRRLGVRPVLVGRRESLTSEFWLLHLLHGLGAVADARGDAPGGAAKPVVLGVQAVKRFERVPLGGPGHGTLRQTRTSKQAGKPLRSQGHPHAHVM